MDFIKKTILGIILLATFIFLVSFSTLYAQTHIIEGTACQCTLPIPLLIPTFSSLGVMVGSIVYYLMFPKIKESEEKVMEKLRKILTILDPDEREVIELVIKNKGRVTQSVVSRRMGKVKAFRVIERLRKRGVLKKEPYGKTNMVSLTEDFEKILVSL